MESISSLSQLVPSVAISVIFAVILISINKSAGIMHKEKTVAFMQSLKDQRDSFMKELAEIRQENRSDREGLRKAIAENTSTMKNVLDVLKKNG